MCGKEGPLYKTDIESTILNVCKDCSKFGKVIGIIEGERKKERKVKKNTAIREEPEKDVVLIISEDYAEKIKGAREQLGIKQEDFAKKINEKESLIHKIETGHFEPNIDLAMKIERALKINIIEQYEEKHTKKDELKSDVFTIGDMLKTK